MLFACFPLPSSKTLDECLAPNNGKPFKQLIDPGSRSLIPCVFASQQLFFALRSNESVCKKPSLIFTKTIVFNVSWYLSPISLKHDLLSLNHLQYQRSFESRYSIFYGAYLCHKELQSAGLVIPNGNVGRYITVQSPTWSLLFPLSLSPSILDILIIPSHVLRKSQQVRYILQAAHFFSGATYM